MAKNIMRNGTHGWIAMWALVLVWDSFADETMSDAFERHVGIDRERSHLARSIPVNLWAVLTILHLYNITPRKYDPYCWIGEGLIKIGKLLKYSK